jgi:hypothetical protein
MDSMELAVATPVSGQLMSSVRGQSPLLEGDYYEGAFGPTILLILTSSVAVDWLRAMFDRMAQETIGAVVSLLDQPRVAIGAALPGLRLALVEREPDRHLVRGPDGGFTWSCTTDEWHTASLMLEPFTDGQAGHQYLTSEVDDDAIIEISYGEDHG